MMGCYTATSEFCDVLRCFVHTRGKFQEGAAGGHAAPERNPGLTGRAKHCPGTTYLRPITAIAQRERMMAPTDGSHTAHEFLEDVILVWQFLCQQPLHI